MKESRSSGKEFRSSFASCRGCLDGRSIPVSVVTPNSKRAILSGGRNLVFECQQCGECCGYLGQVFEIVERYDNYSFLARNRYTGENHLVSVTPPLYHLYDDREIFSELPEACPFFRKCHEDGLYYCTVHLTRPDICREYGCWRFLILDSQGKRAGRVMQSRHLHAEDPLLEQIWDLEIRTLHEEDDRIWDQKMREIVKKAGFLIRE